MAAEQKTTSRRQFIFDAARMACGVGMLGLGLGLYTRQALALPPVAVRPPGAGGEPDFLGACIRCGLCVRDCPPQILSLAKPEQPIATGTPYFVARSGPCAMCEDIPCVKACPTGALDHKLTDITKARMGLAVLVDKESCLNMLGLRCDICYRVCPVIDKAIKLEPRHNERTGRHTIFEPVVYSNACTGCGMCEQACPLKTAAIKVYPIQLAKGEIGEHYRLGWEEKRKAGRSLVTPEIEHQYNLPEGLKYEFGGRGLVPDTGAAGAAAAPPPAPGPAAPSAPPGAASGLPKAFQGNQL